MYREVGRAMDLSVPARKTVNVFVLSCSQPDVDYVLAETCSLLCICFYMFIFELLC